MMETLVHYWPPFGKSEIGCAVPEATAHDSDCSDAWGEHDV
jgi:hypothetical protein